MNWARFGDEHRHKPRIANAGALGFGLHTAAVLWCAEQKEDTEGRIPRGTFRTLLDHSSVVLEVEERGKRRNLRGTAIADYLADNLPLLFQRSGDTITVLNIEEHLLSAAERAKRAATSAARVAAGSKGGLRSWEVRSKPEAIASANVEANRSKPKQT